MPMYGYNNLETGEYFEEFRPMSRELDGVDGVKIARAVSCPTVFPSAAGYDQQKRSDKFREKIVDPIVKNHNPRGIIKPEISG